MSAATDHASDASPWDHLRSFFTLHAAPTAKDKARDTKYDMQMAAEDAAEAARLAAFEAKARALAGVQMGTDAVKDGVQMGTDALKDGMQMGSDALKDGAEYVKDGAEYVKQMVGSGSEQVWSNADYAKNRMADAYDYTKEEIEDIANAASDWARKSIKSFKQGADMTEDEVEAVAKDAADRVRRSAGRAREGITAAGERVRGAAMRRPGDAWRHATFHGPQSTFFPQVRALESGYPAILFPTAGILYSSLLLAMLAMGAVRARRYRGASILATSTTVEGDDRSSSRSLSRKNEPLGDHKTAGREQVVAEVEVLDVAADVFAPSPSTAAAIPLACSILLVLESVTNWTRLGVHVAFLTMLLGSGLQVAGLALSEQAIRTKRPKNDAAGAMAVVRATKMAAAGELAMMYASVATGLIGVLCAVRSLFG